MKRCIVIFAAVVVTACNGESVVNSQQWPLVIETSALPWTDYSRSTTRCYITLWCAHCDNGRGRYIRTYVRCPRTGPKTITYPGGSKLVPSDSN